MHPATARSRDTRVTVDQQSVNKPHEHAHSSVVAIAASDEILARRLLTALVRDGFEVIGVSRSTKDVLAESPPPAVTVIAARGDDALAELETARRSLSGTRIVVVAPDTDGRLVRDALAAGADGIVLDAELEHSLGPTISCVLAGQVVVPRGARQTLDRPVLSARERHVAGMVVLGFSNGEIAAKLHIAETTVKSHLSSIFRKLGVRSRSEASARILDLSEGLGVGFLSIAEADPALDVFGDF